MKRFIYILFVLFCSLKVFSQVNLAKQFSIRTSGQAPDPYTNKQIYNLRGDFLLLGNANARVSEHYTSDGNNSLSANNTEDMRFIDIDNDSSTVNSTSATLVKPTDIDLSCTKIVYAGLYWTGRNNASGDNIPYKLTKSNGNYNPISNSPTLNRKNVKFKAPGMNSYVDLTASDIYFSDIESTRYMYTAYADVTNYVKDGKFGEYFVGNIACRTGNDATTGFYAGWGMVIIYENPEKKWRDITVFDGFAFVRDNNNNNWTDGTVNLNGFHAAQSGRINVSMGMMAAEGDRNISDDRFQIRKSGTTSTFVTLQHSKTNSTSNFFNSSVIIDGTKNPDFTNNFGIDIIKMDLPNVIEGSGNSFTNDIIKNNDNSTQFRYGSDGDTYSIFNIVFAVDAYVPEIEVFAKVDPTTTADINNLQPNDEVILTADIYNYGSDAITNGNLQITIPAGMQLVSTSVHTNSQTDSGANASYSFNTPTWINPISGVSSATMPAATLGGILEWKLGNVPTQNLVGGNKVPMATLTYKLKVTDNCMILQASANDCILHPEITGKVTGKGVNSGANFEQGFTTGYREDCNNTPEYGGLNMEIKPSPTFLNNCSANNPVVNGVRMFKRFCSVTGNVIPRTEITDAYPDGTKFYTDAGVEITGTNGFHVNSNGTITNYRAVLPGSPISCYLKLATQLDVITTQPTTNDIIVCQGESIVLNNQPSSTAYDLFYFQDEADTTPMADEPAPTTAGTHTYWVAEGTTNGTATCFGAKVSFTITIHAAPVELVLTDLELCTFADYVSTINPNGATVVWEYWSGTVWVGLSNQLAGVSIVSNQLTITKAPVTLNGNKFRVKLTNATNCSSYSNEMTLTVKGCQMPVNPMIYTPLNR